MRMFDDVQETTSQKRLNIGREISLLEDYCLIFVVSYYYVILHPAVPNINTGFAQIPNPMHPSRQPPSPPTSLPLMGPN
jgi:hypothetical protein